jgi:hypothetical protein
MRKASNRWVAALAVAALLGLFAGDALAEARSKSTQTEAVWIKFDPATQTVTARIKKPGQGAKPPRHLAVKKGQEATFLVQPTGSVLKRTTVSINGKKGELTDIPEGKTVNIYWAQDEKDDKARFARKIDVIFSEEELDEMYPDEE